MIIYVILCYFLLNQLRKEKKLAIILFLTVTYITNFIAYFKKIYLAVPGLSRSKQDLQFSLWYVGSLVATCELLVAAWGI